MVKIYVRLQISFCCVEQPLTSDLFFPRNIPFPASVVFLTNHDTLLTTRGQRTFFASVFFFVTASKAADTM